MITEEKSKKEIGKRRQEKERKIEKREEGIMEQKNEKKKSSERVNDGRRKIN